MKKWMVFSFIVLLAVTSRAQEVIIDTAEDGQTIIEKDYRIDVLGEKMYAHNAALIMNIRSAPGYRLMLLSTNDQKMAMQLRSTLLQQYPEHKVYMTYQNPFIKLKMGDFLNKEDAEAFKKLLLKQKIIPGNIYLLPETIEIKPEKYEEQ